MVTLKLRFDGEVFVPEEPVDLPRDQIVVAQVRLTSETPKSFDSLIGRAFDYPPNPNPRMYTDDDLWKKD